MPIELHCHSTASDGHCTPTELVERALALGITSLAITDHDCVDGVAEAMEASSELSLNLIPAVEISCHFEDYETHLLGYFIEHRDPEFRELLEDLKDERRRRVHRILASLQEIGLGLSYEEVKMESTGEALGRPHVARALVNKGVVGSVSQAFQLYLGNGKPAYVRRELLSLEAAIEAIHKAGGVAVLAHPGVYGDWPRVERMLKLEIDGIEVWHPSHKKAQRKRAKRLGGRYNKVLTGGSDFHGPSVSSHEMGSARVTEGVVSKLFEIKSGRARLA